MKISLITVCYNSAATIRRAMESVAAQKYGEEQSNEVASVREAASKPLSEQTDADRRRLVDAIEATDVIALKRPEDERMKEFVKGYWEGDAKLIKEIVAWGASVVPERVVNRYIGEIQTHRNSIRSILFHTRFRGPLKVLVLERLPRILQDAVLYNKGIDGDETFYNLAHRMSFDPGDGNGVKEFVARLIVKETADGNRTWTIEFSNKKELTGVPTTGEAATVEVTHLKPPSTHTILKCIYRVNRCTRLFAAKRFEVEYIVIDGGSTDGTVEEIKKFELRVKNEVEKVGGGGQRNFSFKWVSEKDRGMYDALNKGIRMATGDVVGILNADDWLDGDEALGSVVRLFDCSDCPIDAVYGDIRFVKDGKTVRYYSAKRWKPWMFQWGKMPPHPGVYIRRECFEEYGSYKMGYYIASDYELLIRFLRKNAIRAQYLDKCLVCMGLGGRSTKNWKSNLILNQEIVRANRENGYFCCLPMLLPKYFFKIWEFILPKLGL